MSTFVAIVPVAGGFSAPVGIAHAGDGSGRLFLVQQGGLIRVFDGSQVLATPFLNISSRILCCGERGLLGLAFHPTYPANGFFYVYYTRASDGDIVVARYQVSSNPNVANPDSEAILLVIEHSSQSNHNGGHLAFGSDGYLYIGVGDGGGSGDPDENGQNINSLLGKILRIDVDGGPPYGIPSDNPFVGRPGADEIWISGLRNPWRFSFDRLTGDLFVGDVGQNTREEISVQPAASPGGENYGWDVLEGTFCHEDVPAGSCSAFLSGGSVLPVLEYGHDATGGCSVTGGYVFRGQPYGVLSGNYLYGDYCSGRIWRGIPDGTGGWTSQELFDTAFKISSFGEDEEGGLYLVDHVGGTLQRITPYTFADVPPTGFGWQSIESIFAAGITAGCAANPLLYCPGSSISRAQMAIFLLRAKHGQTHLPPQATGTIFDDVPTTSFAAAWIEQLFAEGITSGCSTSPPLYCPSDPITREQMAVFILKTLLGSSFTPPPATGLFSDVPVSNPFAAWIEELSRRGITSGCGGGNYCPAATVTRAEMAIFLDRAFSLP